jgi:hypothetical protein
MGKLGTSNIWMRKNLLINGDMRIAQWDDGTATGIGNGDTGYHTVDRWKFAEAGTIGGTCTMAQDESEIPSDTGFKTSLFIGCTAAEAAVGADEYAILYQSIEAQDLQHLLYGYDYPKTLTISFYIKAAVKSGTMTVFVTAPDASRSYLAEVSVTTSWARHTIVMPGDRLGQIDDDNGAGLNVGFCIFGGANYQGTADTWNSGIYVATSNQTNFWDAVLNELYITGVQVELGKQYTGFDFRPFEQELEMCERYLYKTYQLGTPIGGATNTGAWGYSHCRGSIDYRKYVTYGTTRMRTTPTVTFYSGSTGASGKIRNQTAGADVTMTSLDEGECGCADHDIGTSPTDGDRFQGQYACDAEL